MRIAEPAPLMPAPLALFAATMIALAAGTGFQVDALVVSYFYGDQMPTTELYQTFFWLWFPAAVVVVLCGLRGGYQLVRRGDLRSRALIIFLTMSCFTIKPDGFELGFSAVRLAVDVGVKEFRIGINVLGLALIWWLATLRRRYVPPPDPLSDHEAILDAAT